MFKRFTGFISGISTLWGFMPATVTAYVTAALWSAVMSVIGYLQGVPVIWLMTLVPLALASIFTFVLRASEWRERNSIEGKFLFQGVVLGGDYQKDPTTGAPSAIEKLQVGLFFQSVANFPISFIIESYHSSFEGRIPQQTVRTDNGAILYGQHDPKLYRDNPIDASGLALKPAAEGTARFVVRFGPPGREKHKMSKNIKYQAQLNPALGGYVSPGY